MKILFSVTANGLDEGAAIEAALKSAKVKYRVSCPEQQQTINGGITKTKSTRRGATRGRCQNLNVKDVNTIVSFMEKNQNMTNKQVKKAISSPVSIAVISRIRLGTHNTQVSGDAKRVSGT